MKISSDRFISVFVTVKDAFPELQDNYETLKALLTGIDRNSALMTCAQINLELADPMNTEDERDCTPDERRLRRQQKLVPLFFSQTEAGRLNEFVERHSPAEPIIFFREQVLELIRWIALICRDEPGGELGGADRDELNRRFTKALLIAGSFWSRRVYRDDLPAARGRPRAETVETAVRAFRNAATFRLDPITALSRGRCLIREICARDRNFEDMFERKTHLSLDDYFLGFFVLLGFTLGHHSRSGLSALINAKQTIAEAPSVESGLTRVLELAAQSGEALRSALREGRSEPTANDLTFYDLRPLMKKPVLLVSLDQFVVLDAAFCAAQATVGPLFHVVEGASVADSKRIFGAFGKAFEDYCFEALRSMYPVLPAPLFDPLSLNVKGTEASGKELEVDAVLTLSTSRTAALFEIKSAFVPDILLAGNPEEYVHGLRRRYGVTEEEGVKGTGQLARFVSAVAAGAFHPEELAVVERIMPVLLVYDPLLDAPLHTEFLAQEFTEALAPDERLRSGEMMKGDLRVANLIVMTVDDLENLESSVREFSLMQLLSSYSEDFPNRDISLHNYMACSPYFSRHIWYSERLRERFSRDLESIRKPSWYTFERALAGC